MNGDIAPLLTSLTNFAALTPRERESALRRAVALREADPRAVTAPVLAALAALDPEARTAAQPLVAALVEQLAHAWRGADRAVRRAALTEADRSCISLLYKDLREQSAVAWGLVGLLAAVRGDEELRLVAELLVEQPPADAPQLPVALAPLFQRDDYDPAALFPRLLDGLARPHLAGAILDLANYLTRAERVVRHPATERGAELQLLLGALVQRLGRIEEDPDAAGRSAREVGTVIAESLPLAISLCDALALIGDPAAMGKLHQAMELRHRRLRTEAAAALARLGDRRGEDILVELAAEPVARLRVLAYARELGLLDRIAAEHQTAVARAESELALWLAQPSQFGLPPTGMELVDQRELYWPGYDDPVECFLFRFHYNVGGGMYSGIGIAGPLEHAFTADLADLPPDDIYAAFAGWHAQHAEIREREVAALKERQQVEVARLERRLHDAGFEAIIPVTLALFFGERVLVATATHEGRPGNAIVTGAGEISWLPRGAARRPLGPAEAFCIFKGRRLLRTFNA